MMFEPGSIAATRRRELIAEADAERLAAQLPHAPAGLRRDLAAVCVRLAQWLDEPDQYVSTAEPGPQNWVSGASSG